MDFFLMGMHSTRGFNYTLVHNFFVMLVCSPCQGHLYLDNHTTLSNPHIVKLNIVKCYEN